MAFYLRVIVKALLLFVLANLLVIGGYMPSGHLPGLGQFSLYNHVFPGRPRFPFGEAPREAYNFSLFDVEAMFESHAVDADKPDDEYRVVLIGDSSVWGTLLRPEQTLAGQLNAYGLTAPGGRSVRFYNLGYPTLSLTKDLLLLDSAVRHQDPDMVIWLTTLEAFPRDKQLAAPLVANNPIRAQALIRRFALNLDAAEVPVPPLWERSIIGQRKNLADLVRLQMYGILWSATGIDQFYPAEYPPAQVDLEPDPLYYGKETLERSDLAFDVLFAGLQVAQGRDASGRVFIRDVPVLIVNEPILISTGENSAVRYNFYYPRGAYDQYRAWMAQAADEWDFAYLDLWDIVPPAEFTNSAIHVNEQGTGRIAERIAEAMTGLMGSEEPGGG